MKEIKFRAWIKQSWSSELQMWIKKRMFYDVFLMDGYIRVNSSLSSANFDECEIMQFVGIKDKNDKEIYEGDLVKIETNNKWIFRIEFNNFYCSFLGQNIYDDSHDIILGMQKLEIIGNIYENPELLKIIK